jgi:hypothetical protein
LRRVAYTDCDRDGDGNINSNADTHTYANSKGYSDAETSANSSPTPVSRGTRIATPKGNSRAQTREFPLALAGTAALPSKYLRPSAINYRSS